MKRRSFVIGIGALSVGSAAAVGTGAFSSAEATRDVSVEVVDDADAYLAIRSESDYAVVEDGVLELDFGQDLGDDLGEHVGKSSVYQFGAPRQDYWVFSVENQGTQEVELTPSRQTLYFDDAGNLVSDNDDNIELLIAIQLEDDGENLSPGQSSNYLVQISTGDNPPNMSDIDPEDAIFEINAEEA